LYKKSPKGAFFTQNNFSIILQQLEQQQLLQRKKVQLFSQYLHPLQSEQIEQL
jgi:hypothetical protein